MAILAGDIKKGVCLRLDDGKIWVVIDFLHKKPGKGNTVMITKLRNVEDGRVLEGEENRCAGNGCDDALQRWRRAKVFEYSRTGNRIILSYQR